MAHTNLVVCAKAIRTCWESFKKSDSTDEICGEADRNLITRIGNKEKHASTLEHLTFSFFIEGISRACLQELARHRMASLSVKSTRYTLKELKEETKFDFSVLNDYHRAKKYIVMTDDVSVDNYSIMALENLRQAVREGMSNDITKYCMPECYKTTLTWTINARALQNFLSLRTSPRALWEIRNLANAIYDALPEDYKYIFKDSLYANTNHEE